MNDKQLTRAKVYKAIAVALGGVGGAAFVAALIAYAIGMSAPLSESSTDWGTFGDFVGGIAGTVIALITLVALVVALHLQAKELEETRQALQDQVVASKDQLQLIEDTERVRIQPVLKVEWFPYLDNMNTVILRFTNIGFGPCLMEQVHVQANSQHVGSHDLEDWNTADVVWKNALRNVLGSNYPDEKKVWLEPMNKYRKLLAAGETQQMVVVNFPDHKTARKALGNLQMLIEIDIEFKSLGKAQVHTAAQEILFN